MTPRLPPDLLDLYEERAAIIEFCGNMSRADAERLAFQDVSYNHSEQIIDWMTETSQK